MTKNYCVNCERKVPVRDQAVSRTPDGNPTDTITKCVACTREYGSNNEQTNRFRLAQ